MQVVLAAMLAGLAALFRSRLENALRIAALEQQLGMLLHRRRPRPSRWDRLFWSALARSWPRWRDALVALQPATVVRWHRRGFRALWRWKSRLGRPGIPGAHARLIQKISTQHPELGEDQIALELETKLGVRVAASTVRRYRHRRGARPPGRYSGSWRAFVARHADAIWACDFAVQTTACFVSVYIFVIVEIATRRIVSLGVTTDPSLSWVKTQIRLACPFDSAPRFLIHDNDGIFGQHRSKRHRRTHRCALDSWLMTAMGIQGIPIPYGAPNANAHAERLVRSLRERVLDHYVFANDRHVRRVLSEYVAYHNGARPSQATGRIPDPYAELQRPPRADGAVVALPVLRGLHHDYRRAA